MRFRYFRLPLPERSEYFGTNLLKPIIPVGVRVGEDMLEYAALKERI